MLNFLAGLGKDKGHEDVEYDPAPPFRSGHPEVADPELVARLLRERFSPRVQAQKEAWEQRKR